MSIVKSAIQINVNRIPSPYKAETKKWVSSPQSELSVTYTEIVYIFRYKDSEEGRALVALEKVVCISNNHILREEEEEKIKRAKKRCCK